MSWQSNWTRGTVIINRVNIEWSDAMMGSTLILIQLDVFQVLSVPFTEGCALSLRCHQSLDICSNNISNQKHESCYLLTRQLVTMSISPIVGVSQPESRSWKTVKPDECYLWCVNISSGLKYCEIVFHLYQCLCGLMIPALHLPHKITSLLMPRFDKY